MKLILLFWLPRGSEFKNLYLLFLGTSRWSWLPWSFWSGREKGKRSQTTNTQKLRRANPKSLQKDYLDDRGVIVWVRVVWEGLKSRMVIDVPTTLVEVIDSDDDFRQDGRKVSHYKKEQSFSKTSLTRAIRLHYQILEPLFSSPTVTRSNVTPGFELLKSGMSTKNWQY